MRDFIFLTTEGFTFQPESEEAEPDIENCQVIGFAKGKNSKDAYKNLIKENDYFLETTFDEIFTYELVKDYRKNRDYFFMSETTA